MRGRDPALDPRAKDRQRDGAVLEDSPRYLYSFLERFHPKDIPVLFGEYPAWRLLLKQDLSALERTRVIVTEAPERADIGPAHLGHRVIHRHRVARDDRALPALASGRERPVGTA